MSKLHKFIVVMTDDEVLTVYSKDEEMTILSEMWLFFEKNKMNTDDYYINMNNVKYVKGVVDNAKDSR